MTCKLIQLASVPDSETDKCLAGACEPLAMWSHQNFRLCYRLLASPGPRLGFGKGNTSSQLAGAGSGGPIGKCTVIDSSSTRGLAKPSKGTCTALSSSAEVGVYINIAA